MFWYAVHTSARLERKVDAHLSKEGISLLTRDRRGGATDKMERKGYFGPIFPKTRSSPGCRLRAIKTKGVVEILGSNGNPAVSGEKQIHTI